MVCRHAICYIKYPFGFLRFHNLQFRKKSIEYVGGTPEVTIATLKVQNNKMANDLEAEKRKYNDLESRYAMLNQTGAAAQDVSLD